MPDGGVYLTDFGLARMLLEEKGAKKSDLVGTLEYMSPEQIAGKEIDLRSDIYAVGKILQDMVMGKVSQAEIAEESAHIPVELTRVIRKCLAQDKQDHYQNTKELSADLERLEEDLSGSRTSVTRLRSLPSGGPRPGLRRSWILGAVLVPCQRC